MDNKTEIKENLNEIKEECDYEDDEGIKVMKDYEEDF